MVDIAKRSVSEGVGTGVEEEGFRASLSKATLPDLVQMECLAQSDSAFRVISGGRVGYLFFQRGQVAHALVDDLAAEEAALEILSWQRGIFEPCRVARPQSAPIRTGWQQLVLTAARVRDESRRTGPSAVAEQPLSASAGDSEKPPLAATKPVPRPQVDAKTTPRPADVASLPPSAAASSPSASAYEFVRLDPSGNVLSGRGDIETLTQVGSYAARIAELIGDALGMSRFLALEAILKDEHKLVHVDAEGGTLALFANGAANLANVRKKLDL